MQKIDGIKQGKWSLNLFDTNKKKLKKAHIKWEVLGKLSESNYF